MIKRNGISICLIAFLTSCSSFSGKQKPAPVYGEVVSSKKAVKQVKVTTTKAVVQPPIILKQQEIVELPPPSKSSNVVVALLADADSSYQQGHVDESVATIERALRIEPRNALLLYKLAVLKVQQGEPELAENLAKKSALLAEGNATLKKKNWLLIADIHEQQGDLASANTARSKANEF